jgi:hypothetical protein
MRINYQLHHVRFAVEVDESLAGAIKATVMPDCVRTRPAGLPRTVFTIRQSSAGFSLHRAGRRLWDTTSEMELIPWVEFEVTRWLLGRFRSFLQLHAAVVERGGRAVIIAGAPDSGKTSLACALGLTGWQVMGDEVALVRRGEVLAFPRAMLVKAGTARRLAELRPVPARTVWLEQGAEKVRYVAPSHFGKARTSARIVAVVFPEWARREAVGDIGALDALERLLGCSLNVERTADKTVKGCVDVARRTRAIRVGVAKLRDTAHLLTQAIGTRQ